MLRFTALSPLRTRNVYICKRARALAGSRLHLPVFSCADACQRCLKMPAHASHADRGFQKLTFVRSGQHLLTHAGTRLLQLASVFWCLILLTPVSNAAGFSPCR
jgi:hypothetical protein